MPRAPSWQAVRGHSDRAPTQRPPAPPAFVSAGLLAGLLPAASEARLAELVESQLVRLNACEARLDLELAAVLATFSLGNVHVLGHGDREAFASERIGFSWSHARELLEIRKKLETLPMLRSAFLLGIVRRARLREIAKVATPETQAAWLAAARSLTSGELSARVKGARGKDAANDLTDPPAATDRVGIRVSPEEAVFIESVGLPMLRCVTGLHGPKHALIKHMTAEILCQAWSARGGMRASATGWIGARASRRGRPPR